MALKDLIGKLTGKPSRGPWQPAAGPFPRLMLLDAAAIDSLKDAGGLFALWHRGVRPQWIYVGYADDLADTLTAAQSDPDIELYNLNEGVFVSWAECPAEERASAVVHLKTLLEPAIASSPLDELGPVDPETKPTAFPAPVD